MNYKKLIKKIEKYYYSHNQYLILDTREEMQNNEQDTSFEVYLADSDIYLFEVQNYNNLTDLDIYFTNWFKNPSHIAISRWDGVKASYLPLYYNGIITLKTFDLITKPDIINCTNYFTREILGGLFFNIKFKGD